MWTYHGESSIPPVTEQHRDLQRSYEECTQIPPNDVEIFEKVLGARRGHVKGIRREPSLKVPHCFVQGESLETQTQSKQNNQFEMILDDLVFRARLVEMMQSYNAQQDDGGNNEDKYTYIE
ncbi:hypothetical protein L2E82_25014 [Cichorium intybus]|uniref:Uncharacterized protein n=1 Tax=Cichorium intybus TaxID=13427 RepID=A0ACB9E2H2_CICIN|nr:hypothetical protein L2E82_25014 [Cichorium intybus]